MSDAVSEMAMGLGYVAITVCFVELTPWWSLLLVGRAAGSQGRMAFTNYIVQSLVFGWIFFGYGLGLFGTMSIGRAAAVGAAVYFVQVLCSHWWLSRFGFGPLEYIASRSMG